jgi:hypothetical protein
MANFDVFNGDADGICALTQYRLAHPASATLVTGVKRDINLLKRVEAQPGDHITVLDVSLDKNRDGLIKVLEQGAIVFYADHHFSGEIPASDRLTAAINTAPNVCTSILVNQHIGGQFKLWGVTGAFGDNLDESARSLAGGAFDEATLARVKDLGTYLNYNGYGKSLDDLHFAPADLYKKVCQYASPIDFMEAEGDTFGALQAGYTEDMAAAQAAQPVREPGDTAVYILPNEKWARRVSGVYSNGLARATPSRAHAVLTHQAGGTFLVSVRAPLDNKTGADELCRSFPTGGGRKAAAGINQLPADMLDTFIDRFSAFYAR